MSDKRRRRKGTGGSEESDLSETEPDTKSPAAEHGDSEYESADENILNSPNPPKTKQKDVTENGENNENTDMKAKDIDDAGDDEIEELDESKDDYYPEEGSDTDSECLDYKDDGGGEEPFPERQEGDGEETPTSVDDDEDKKNPQYIPKKGMFYEHDDRLGTDEEMEEEKEPERKKIWKADAAEKWGHDKFMELDQEPKSKDELVASYGYDIRNEDNAPRARRRRRYGRGPNKYTRNWEDEDAYSKPGPKGRNPPAKIQDNSGKDIIIEDFPALPGRDEEKPVLKRDKSKPDMKKDDRKFNRRSEEKDDISFRNDRGRGKRGGGPMDKPRGRGSRGGSRGGGPGGMDNLKRGGFGRGGYEDRKRHERYLDRFSNEDDRRPEDEHRGGRGRGGRGRGRGNDSRDFLDRKKHVQDQSVIVRPEDLGDELRNLDLHKDNDSNGMAPPQRGGKRYSNQRRGGAGDQSSISPDQRNLQEMYDEGINPALCSGPPRGAPFQPPVTSRVPHNTMVSHSGGRPVPVSFIQNPQMINYNPQFTAPVTGPPVSLPIGVGPAVPLTAIPTMTGNMTAPLIAPGFANGPPEAVLLAAAAAANQPTGPDGFAAVRGGVTYFNPTAQNILQQRSVSKRPKAAIPIVDPAVVESKDLVESNSLPLSGENQELAPQL